MGATSAIFSLGNSFFVELILALDLLGVAVTIIVLSKSDILDERTSEMRNYMGVLWVVSYLIETLFMHSTWLIGVILRAPISVCLVVYNVI